MTALTINITRRFLIGLCVLLATVAVAIVVTTTVIGNRAEAVRDERGRMCVAALANGYDWAIDEYCDE